MISSSSSCTPSAPNLDSRAFLGVSVNNLSVILLFTFQTVPRHSFPAEEGTQPAPGVLRSLLVIIIFSTVRLFKKSGSCCSVTGHNRNTTADPVTSC